MSENVVLKEQDKLTEVTLNQAEEIQEHLVKAQSVIDVVTNSIEAKNTDNKLELASELNSLVTAYDELEHALGDIDEVIGALKDTMGVDANND